jgi:hypothetical protein
MYPLNLIRLIPAQRTEDEIKGFYFSKYIDVLGQRGICAWACIALSDSDLPE